MAKKKAVRDEAPDLATLLPKVKHLPVRSLPFNKRWRDEALKKWLALVALGVTQKDFGAWIGCAQGSVSNVLGEKEPTFWRTDYLERFSLALGVELPMRAQVDIESIEIDDDDVGMAKLVDMIRWVRSQQAATKKRSP